MRFVIYSGGMDSYTLLHNIMWRTSGKVTAISFDYGQRHKKELFYAREECARLDIPHIIVDMRGAGNLLTGSSLTDGRVPTPHGHYAAENMKKTVVPGRNTIMLSVAMGIAESRDLAADEHHHILYYGAHAGDHFIYPDCRPEYIQAMQNVFIHATGGKVVLEAPMRFMTKGDIVQIGEQLRLEGAPVNYANTWTCYEGGDEPCGKCGACVERAEAFQQNGIEDPLLKNPIREYFHR